MTLPLRWNAIPLALAAVGVLSAPAASAASRPQRAFVWEKVGRVQLPGPTRLANGAVLVPEAFKIIPTLRDPEPVMADDTALGIDEFGEDEGGLWLPEFLREPAGLGPVLDEWAWDRDEAAAGSAVRPLGGRQALGAGRGGAQRPGQQHRRRRR